MAQLAPVGAGLGILGAAVSTKANIDALDEQARLSEWESRAKQAEAESIRESAALQERQYGRKARLLQGKAVALAAASGVSIQSGTPLFLELDNIKQAAIGRLEIIRQGELAAKERELQSAFNLRQAAYARGAKKGAIVGGVLRGATILSSFMGSAKGPGFGAAAPTTATSGSSPFYSDDSGGF